MFKNTRNINGNKTETIGGDGMEEVAKLSKLTEALSKAQSIIQGALKDSENPFFKSSYADLASTWEACRKPLTDNGLAIIQITKMIEGKLYLETILSHVSGELISGIYPINPMRQEKEKGWFVSEDPQSLGSALTYARRYALAAIVGVAPEDDDGEGAMGRGKGKDDLKKPEAKRDKGATTDPNVEGKGEPKRIKTVVLKVENKERESEIVNKEGKKEKKISKWFIVHTEGEGIYRTFSESFKKVAEEGQTKMLFVEIEYTVSKYGNEIQSIKLISDEGSGTIK